MERETRITTKELVFTAMFAAIVAVLSQISIPLPSGVPVTLQTFAVAIAGYMLGKKWGTASIAVYILLGAAGAPVFTGFKGGFASMLGVTGGFIWGFMPMAFFCGLGSNSKNKPIAIAAGLIGLLLCHLCGTLQWTAIKGGGIVSGFLTVSFPYLLKDSLSVVFACIISDVLKKRVEPELHE